MVSSGDVLVVDDTPDNLDLLEILLRDGGHEPRTASSGTAAPTAGRSSPAFAWAGERVAVGGWVVAQA